VVLLQRPGGTEILSRRSAARSRSHLFISRSATGIVANGET
jgi:hypothetical protein